MGKVYTRGLTPQLGAVKFDFPQPMLKPQSGGFRILASIHLE
jgi:hypothetical protein